jgi:uncharacterized protein (DUF736 family)
MPAVPVAPAEVPTPDFQLVYVLPSSVREGTRLTYQIQLTNVSGKGISFAQKCPGYTESLKAARVYARYMLNCSAIGTIAPNEKVTLQMDFDIPVGAASSRQGLEGADYLDWQLDSPFNTVNVNGPGTILVTAA